MRKNDPSEMLRRRNFLKTAGGVAMALAARGNLFGQSAASNSAAQKNSAERAPPDRGLWIAWYDLPAGDSDAYFSWSHGTYLPVLLKRPGYLWAAHYASQDLEGGADNATRYKHIDDPKVSKGYH